MDKIQKSKSEKIRIKNIATWILYIAMIILFAICLVGIILSLVYYFNFDKDNTLIGATATFSVGLLAASIQFTIVIKSGKASKDKNITRTINLYNSYSDFFAFTRQFQNFLEDAIRNKSNIKKINIELNESDKCLYYTVQNLIDHELLKLKTKDAQIMVDYAKNYLDELDEALFTLFTWFDSGQIDERMFTRLFNENIKLIYNIKDIYEEMK